MSTSSPPGSAVRSRLRSAWGVLLPVPVPAVQSSLRLSSRVLRGASELLVFAGSLGLAVLGVPRLLFFVQSDVLISQCVLLTAVLLYGSAALLLSSRYPLPPSQPSPARLSVPAGVLFGLLLCWCLTWLLLPVLGSSTREDPLILQLCFSAAQQPLLLLDLSLLGPLREELLFRGLLFGRLCRLLSPAPAYAASSAVFGLLHWSPDSVKVLECVASGLVLALSYRLTLSLWAPIAVHCANNLLVVLLTAGLSPLCAPSTVERSMRVACRIEDAVDRAVYSSKTAVGAGEGSGGWHWRSGKRDARLACNALFTALDRGGKGYLDAEEIGFFFSLDDSVLDALSAAFTVIHDDCIATAAQPQPQPASLWSDPTAASLPLPARSFFSSLSAQQESAITSLYMALTSPPLAESEPASSSSLVPAPSILLSRLAHSLRAGDELLPRAMHERVCAYYSLFVRVLCEQRSGVQTAGRLSRDEFLLQCERVFVVRPSRLRRMVQQAALIAMGVHPHPLAFAAELETQLGKQSQ